jgi:hypothetical protein
MARTDNKIWTRPPRACPWVKEAARLPGQRAVARQSDSPSRRAGRGLVHVDSVTSCPTFFTIHARWMGSWLDLCATTRAYAPGWLLTILLAAEIVTIHTNPKRKRGNDLATSLTLRVSVSLNCDHHNAAPLPGYRTTGMPTCSYAFLRVSMRFLCAFYAGFQTISA